jgi:RNA polymerase sigma factor for flagellar operon FliA
LSPLPRTPDWSAAVREDGSPERDRFLQSHVDLVRYLALRIASRLPASVEYEDLVHDGILGLLDAAQKYDPARGVRFRTYAERRVRGAILDGLRNRDWRSRAVRRGQREMEETTVRLTSINGRAASEEEIAKAMGMGLAQYRQLLQDASSGPILPLEEVPARSHPTFDDVDSQPHALLERRELLEVLSEELVRLPDRERMVLELYYHEGLNMKEVGAVLGVTESRVCQLHSQAAGRLRAAIKDRMRIPAKGAPEAALLSGERR